MEDIFVYYIDFKNSVTATSTLNEDGSYSIFINARLSQEEQINGYIHELRHILANDFNRKHDIIDRLEYYAHQLIC